MIKKIVFCTLRDNKGATGGPGGVLYLQKELIGANLNQYKCEYWFNSYDTSHSILKKLNKPLFYYKAYKSKNSYFITHDIESAYVLSKLHKNYSLIFHHQGPLVEEKTNFFGELSEKEKNDIKNKERLAFIKANSVHFPSNGAADMFFESKYASCRRDEVNVGGSLFNIILPQPVKDPADMSIREEKGVLTFFSLGTLTLAKGQDQVVDFMAKFLQNYKKPVRYLMVGKGPLKTELESSLIELQNKYDKFSYQMIESMPHNSVMYLHKVSDVYIMMHRISIFDFATLEAMSQSSAVVLSKVGGNLDFDKENNILFAEDFWNNMDVLAKIDFELMKKKNKEVFDKYFSPEAFREQYVSFVDAVVKPLNNV